MFFNILGTTSIVPTVIATTLGVLLLELFVFGVYKQKQIIRNGYLTIGTCQTQKENGAIERNSNKSMKDSHEHCDIVDIHNENCPSLTNFPIRKINSYGITKEYDQFDYLKDVPRCRCYSI